MQWIVGVDEAGRGPLAGPVAVGAVLVPRAFDFAAAFPGLNDSKKLSPKKREELYSVLLHRADAKELHFCVRFETAAAIDRIGISAAVRNGVYGGVRALAQEPAGVQVLLDGLLKAPPEYVQRTIVRGDSTEPAIMLASVAAKVERDRLMLQLAHKFPVYGFERHKGYGTAAHYAAIQQHGLCAEHRQSFIDVSQSSRYCLTCPEGSPQ